MGMTEVTTDTTDNTDRNDLPVAVSGVWIFYWISGNIVMQS